MVIDFPLVPRYCPAHIAPAAREDGMGFTVGDRVRDRYKVPRPDESAAVCVGTVTRITADTLTVTWDSGGLNDYPFAAVGDVLVADPVVSVATPAEMAARTGAPAVPPAAPVASPVPQPAPRDRVLVRRCYTARPVHPRQRPVVHGIREGAPPRWNGQPKVSRPLAACGAPVKPPTGGRKLVDAARWMADTRACERCVSAMLEGRDGGPVLAG